MPREPGFYWVSVGFFQSEGCIEVAKWNGHEWLLAGSEMPAEANLGDVHVLSSRLEPPVAT